MTISENPKVVKPPQVMSIEALRGQRVTNVLGQDLGRVEDIILDVKLARIACVFILFGSIADNKLIPVPWEVVSISFHDQKMVFNISEETIKGLEGYDRNNLPDMSDYKWLEKVFNNFGRKAYWQQ